MRARGPRSLFSLLVWSHLIVVLVTVIAIAALAGSAILSVARGRLAEDLEVIALQAAVKLVDPLETYLISQGSRDDLNRAVETLFPVEVVGRYTLYDPSGDILLIRNVESKRPDRQELPWDVRAALSGGTHPYDQVEQDAAGYETLFVSVPIRRGEHILGALRLGERLNPADSAARGTISLLLPVAILLVLLGGGLGWWMAHSLVNPITDLTRMAGQYARGELQARVTPAGPKELQFLGLFFNRMADQLEAHTTELRNFVANASHELRTPLTSVKLRAEALLDGAIGDPPVAERFLKEIDAEVDRLSEMVNDLLDLSRLEAGMVAPQRVRLNLGKLAAEAHDVFMVRAQNAGVEMHLRVASDVPPVLVDEDQVRRVINNLLDNALKFTPSGGQVVIQVMAVPDRTAVRLEVRDTGVGIPPKDIPHVFERFYRVSGTRPRHHRPVGSGLGLSIARSIIEIHGGTIGVESAPSQGSLFWVEFPTDR